MKYLNHDLITPYQGQNFKIKKEYDDVFFYYNEGFYAESRYSFMVDDLTSDYSSALVVGLGLGVIPQWLANEKGAIVDVVDQDIELINLINSYNYLSDNISIIHSDIFQYTQQKEYDLIVFDIWFDRDNITQEVQNTLNNSFTANQICYPLLR
jgi:hypothetical protein